MDTKRQIATDREQQKNPKTASSGKSVKTMSEKSTKPSLKSLATSIMTSRREQKGPTMADVVTAKMSSRLTDMQKENDKMVHRQERQYGFTVDAADTLKEQINIAKASNANLLAEIQVGKAKFDRLQIELNELRQKFLTSKKQLHSLKKERAFWDETKNLLMETETRYRKLSKINRGLRAVLISHHIDPDTDAKAIRPKLSVPPPKLRKPINAVTIRRKLTPHKVLWN